MRPGRSRVAGERGSGTVLVVGAIGAVLVLVVGALSVVSTVRATHTARAGADLGALAAAATWQSGGSPGQACAAASTVTARNGTTMTACGLDGAGVAVVRVRAVISAPLPGLPRSADGAARAGPGMGAG
ncbi:MAG: flp pilus-assembly TadE/G-like family protein [Micrococcales bacterium]|nr:flp pilus-assembly TadE/G-like family protein [Micrococcales bacterium]